MTPHRISNTSLLGSENSTPNTATEAAAMTILPFPLDPVGDQDSRAAVPPDWRWR